MQLNDDKACVAVLTCDWEGKLKVWWVMKILWVSPIAAVVHAIFLEHLDSKEMKLQKDIIMANYKNWRIGCYWQKEFDNCSFV